MEGPRADAPKRGLLSREACGPASERNSIGVLLCLPTAPGLPLSRNGDFGTSAFFGPLSDKPLLACIQ
jgi:hypothetical protein